MRGLRREIARLERATRAMENPEAGTIRVELLLPYLVRMTCGHREFRLMRGTDWEPGVTWPRPATNRCVVCDPNQGRPGAVILDEAPAEGFFVETRLPAGDPSGGGGLPWTREGCNIYHHGQWRPWPAESYARRAVLGLQALDDPTWRRAEFRVVSGRSR